MEYEGKLYGKAGKIYFPMEETTQDVDNLKSRIKDLEQQLKSSVALEEGSKRFNCLDENIKGSNHRCKQHCGKCVN